MKRGIFLAIGMVLLFLSYAYAVPPSPEYWENKEEQDVPEFKVSSGFSLEGTVLEEKIQTRVTPNIKTVGSVSYSPGTTEKVVVIMVEFPADTPPPGEAGDNPAKTFSGSHDSAYFDDLIFSDDSGEKSMRNYYNEVSYGNLENITGDVYGPYTLDHCMAYYGQDNGSVVDAGWDGNDGTLNSNMQSYRLIGDAIEKADDNNVNFSLYATGGTVDHLIVIHAGGAEETTRQSKDLWSVSWSGLSYATDDGVSVSKGIITSEDSPVGTFAHEFGHSLGLPDLYDSDRGSKTQDPVGTWCLMSYGIWAGETDYGDNPVHICGYLKSSLGWISPTLLASTDDGSHNLGEVETNSKIYKILVDGSSEYFLIENRNPASASALFDKRNASKGVLDSGLIITHINTLRSNNEGQAAGYDTNDPDSYLVWVENPEIIPTSYKVGAAYSSEDGQVSFTPDTTPNTNNNSGESTGISITNISSSGETMTFQLGVPPPPPTSLSVTAGDTTAVLSWTINSESDLAGYNVYRSAASGSGYTIINPTMLSSSTSTYTDTGLANGTVYYYVVTSVDVSSNESGYSSEVNAAPQGAPSNDGGGGGGGGGGGCFIATACFGSPLAEEVKLLCAFRDKCLLSNLWGRKFVSFYYKLSPPIAEFISRHEFFKMATRTVLKPIIWAASRAAIKG